MEIRLVRFNELPLIQQFLNDYWKKDHILSKSIDLMNYQHHNGYGYNFVIGIEEGKIYTALGFIPTNQYDKDIKELDIWLAIWCKTPDCPKGLGSKLLDFIEEAFKPRSIGAIGINDTIEQLYLKRGWVSGVANHYFLPFVDYLAKWEKCEELTLVKEVDVKPQCPAKSNTYVNARYRLNPFYDYSIYGIRDCAFVIRKIYNGRTSILRIVDIFGELPENVQFAFNSLMRFENAQYVDCVNFGIPEEKFLKMGFYLKPDNLIIPNWTEPFVMEHRPLKFACRAEYYIVFKGDSDQDRPNVRT